nr:DUF637 domain-containing protein [Pseudomonas sp. RIT778]
MFVQSSNPQSRYLIETNPELTQSAPFMSSDYLLGKLDFSADEAARRLGDGRYETRLISDAVMAQTGQRFLAGGLNNDYEQYRYLMDNALASKNELNLSVGVSLTSEQVAALTHDIVWMEERVVDGQKVLVPVLYLAQAESRNVRGGSLIQGRDLELMAGNDLVNVGTLQATKDLSVDVKGSLYQGGLVEANERITLMATDSIRNALAGEIRGNQVSLTSLKGDIVNDRTAVAVRDGAGMRTLVDDGGNISARDTLTIKSGNDLVNSSSISSGGDATLSATRDINLLATRNESELHESFDGGHRSVITTTLENLASSVKSGGNLKLDAGRDLNVVASTAEAKGNLTADAKRDIYLSSAGDEHNVETHSKDGKKRVHEEDNHTVQKAAEFIAGGDVKTNSGRDTTLVASKISAGNEAYVYAGNDLNLLAAQNKDYTLYDMKEKGGFGNLKLQRDEVTQITHVGSEIKTGGNLSLVSKGDQAYQVAKLDSGKDIILDSGGSITFEGVKDLHDESHTKTNNNAGWVSSKGRGNTDETLRQTQMIAKGSIVIKAVDGLKIDIKDVSQESVSQTIDAMVKADPQLAWLKDAESRGDVDWRRVKEIHESFKYENSGLGPAAQIAIAIMMSFVMGPGGLALVGGGAGGAFATAMATTAVTSTINNKGNLGAAFKETFSADSLKNAAIAGFTAGVLNYADANWFAGGTSKTANILTSSNITDVAIRTTGRAIITSGISTAIGGGSFGDSFGAALVGQAGSVAMATGFNWVGDTIKFPDGSLEKTVAHALMGGLLSKATGGDFATGAAAAGLNEALMNQLVNFADGNDQLHLMMSQLTGLLAAAAVGGDLQEGAEIARNATQYNWLLHKEVTVADKARAACGAGDGAQACRDNVTRAVAALDAERQRDMEEFGRKIQLQALQEGWTLEQFNAAKASYFSGIDPKELTSVYPPSTDPGFLTREGWIGFQNRAVEWPGGVVDTAKSFWNAVSSPFDTLGSIAGGISGVALGFKDWITSPIPSHTLEKEFDKVATASAEQLGGMVFDTSTGFATAYIGGRAVEWIGGKWVDVKGNLDVDGKVSSIVDAEKNALSRIEQNPKGPDLTGKQTGTILQLQSENRIRDLASQYNSPTLQPRDFQLNIGGKTLQADPQLSIGAPVYSGAATSDVMSYFRQLTGGDSMPSVKSIPGKGDVYAATITSGANAGSKITLRNFSSSSQQSGAAWTIDVINPSINAGKRIEIKFK